MQKVKVNNFFIDDARLDLESLGFEYRKRIDPGGETFEYWDMDITEDLTLSIASTSIGGDRYEVTTEMVIDHMSEVVPINNIYDLYIWIAVHKPAQLKKGSIVEALGRWGTVKEYSCVDNDLQIVIDGFPNYIGAFNEFLLFIRQVYPEYIHNKGVVGNYYGTCSIHLSKNDLPF